MMDKYSMQQFSFFFIKFFYFATDEPLVELGRNVHSINVIFFDMIGYIRIF
jgi:hypothetical protein